MGPRLLVRSTEEFHVEFPLQPYFQQFSAVSNYDIRGDNLPCSRLQLIDVSDDNDLISLFCLISLHVGCRLVCEIYKCWWMKVMTKSAMCVKIY